MENKENKKIYYLLLGAAIIIPIILAVSYAFFQANILGDDEGITGKSTDIFDINLLTENDGYINASNLLLIEENEISESAQKANFKVETGANLYYVNYELTLTNVTISSNLQVDDFKWQLLKNNNVLTSGTFKNVTGNNMILAENILISANKTDEYELRIWIEESGEDQLYLLNGSFGGKISLVADMTDNPIS